MNNGSTPVRPGICQATLIKAKVHYCDYPQPDSIEIPYFDHAEKPIGFSRCQMLGRSLLVGSDVKGNFLHLLGAYRIKSLVGGDKLEAELKRSNHRFELYGNFNIMITSNTRLHVRLEGDRSAWERRLTIVRYENPFSGNRIIDVDKYLLSIEAAGILNWCIEGLRKLFEDYDDSGDIVLSDEQKKRVNSLLSESESLPNFLRGSIVYFNAGSANPYSLTTEEIVDEYVQYCVIGIPPKGRGPARRR